jgi:hypothetical protein
MLSRWPSLARHGLLGTTLLTIAARPAVAEPCGEEVDSSIGLVFGMDFTPKAKVLFGLEGRVCIGDKGEAFARLQVGGGARLIVGSRIRPLESMTQESDRELVGVEAGLALETDGTLGAHLAATYGYHFAYLAAQGLFPLSGRDRPTRAGLVFGVSPWALPNTTQAVDGRPLIHDGQFVRPAITTLPFARGAEARAVRDHFASSAQIELSSVWTFLRLAAELAAAGAPAELIARALDAADDEVRHAELCAHAAGGVELAGLPMIAAQPRFTTRTPRALATLAVEAWLEGCLNETAAAEEARLAARDAETNVEMLTAIARDEDRHAELSWAVLAWVFEVAPAVARAAISDAPEVIAVASPSQDPALARAGVASSKISRAARAHAEIAGRRRLRALAA